MKFFACLFFVSACIAGVSAQSVVVTPRKVVYRRTNAVSEDKTRVTVVYPRINAATRSLSRRIEKTIGMAGLIGLDPKRGFDGDQWLESAGYYVDYNKRGLLAITLSMNGTGAFSSSHFRYLVIDLKTGEAAAANKVFTDLPGLAALVRARQKIDIAQAKEVIALEVDYSLDLAYRFLDTADFTAENLVEFSVSDEGVTFIYDYGFPRTIYPIEPAGNFLIPWSELKPFISRGGLLEKFVS